MISINVMQIPALISSHQSNEFLKYQFTAFQLNPQSQMLFTPFSRAMVEPDHILFFRVTFM